MNREILDFLKMNDVEYKENVSLATISPVRIGGTARIIAYPNGEAKLLKLIRFLRSNKIEHKLLGRMSNVLPADGKYEGVLIRTDRLSNIEINSESISVEAGVSLPVASRRLLVAGLSGFEGLSGIPGSIGGAVVGNAGAFGREICDLVETVRVYDANSEEVVALSSAESCFGYRNSLFKRNDMIILSAKLRLKASDSHSVALKIERFAEIRRKTQPIDKPTLGSTFKRPSVNVSAARLIDDCGLKGYSYGGATVSEKHAGFIINSDGATAKDYLNLSDIVKKRVFEKHGVYLETEIEIM